MGPNAEELKELARKLYELLERPEPGLNTWHLAVHTKIDEIADFHSERHDGA